MPSQDNTPMPTSNGSHGVTIVTVNTGLSGVYLSAFLNLNNTTAVQHEATRNLTALVLAAATKDFRLGLSQSVVNGNGAHHILIPVLRAALPMYVVVQTAFPKADTILVRCIKDKYSMGRSSVEVDWMGRKAFAAGMSFLSAYCHSGVNHIINQKSALSKIINLFLDGKR